MIGFGLECCVFPLLILWFRAPSMIRCLICCEFYDGFWFGLADFGLGVWACGFLPFGVWAFRVLTSCFGFVICDAFTVPTTDFG